MTDQHPDLLHTAALPADAPGAWIRRAVEDKEEES